MATISRSGSVYTPSGKAGAYLQQKVLTFHKLIGFAQTFLIGYDVYTKSHRGGSVAGLYFSPRVLEKLKAKHQVSQQEVEQCFRNKLGGGKFLKDTREQHQTSPATLWFIAETNAGRSLKICFIPPHVGNGNTIEIKTAFEPNDVEINIYKIHG